MNNLVKITPLLFILLLLSIKGYATHNRAGEITYEQVGELTYKITITTFTYTLSPADRDELTAEWGDGTFSTAERYQEIFLADYYKKNLYSATHTFPGPGVYEIVVEDPNRNEGVLNIPNSVQTVFAIKTTLKIDPSTGYNNTPKLLTQPIDKAGLYELFMHNPSAYDPDGDSISYSLATCLREDGEPIENYSLPQASDTIYVNPVTGDFVWDTPVRTGLFNIAIRIDEWRNGVKIGSIIRDMQIEVVDTENRPPEIDSLPTYCVTAGDTVEFTVRANDSPGERIDLTATGGPFQQETAPATFELLENTDGKAVGKFHWITNCAHVRKRPYTAIFKATDDHPEVKLTSFMNAKIKVMAPPVENLQLIPTNRTITLNWDPQACPQATGYHIYRRENKSGFEPDSCQTGVPPSAGFERIATVEGRNTTGFTDDNNQEGLWQGVQYCYIVTAKFPDGAESIASKEKCDVLVRGIPAITNVDVLETSPDAGKIHLKWAYPTEFDSTDAPGPYMYRIYHSPDFWGNSLEVIDSVKGLKNTEYIHEGINTRDDPHSYMIVFWNITPGNRFPVGTPQIASSLFVEPFAGVGEQLTLNYHSNTPWTDTSYTIFRKSGPDGTFDSIATTPDRQFVDTGLENNKEYWYKVRSKGYYSITEGNVPDPIYNNSQEVSAIPTDTIPPCPPDLTIESQCDLKQNYLSWRLADSCSRDVDRYRVYFADEIEKELAPIATIDDSAQTTFTHRPEKSLAGCYAVSAIDVYGNETPISNKQCVDKCFYYKLPNVFTPDGDGTNDKFIPFPYDFVEKVDFKVYNRWGKLVFETDDPDINWDGTPMNSDEKVSDGIYYYVCDVYEHRLTGLEPRYMVGFIHIFTQSGDPKP